MQTFLPYYSYIESAKCLDWRRLGKQRVEAWTIHRIITGKAKSNAWSNHPATNMWRGYDESLADYYNIICAEWINRGYNHNMGLIPLDKPFIPKPIWLDDELIISHRSNLLRKDPIWYGQYGWDISSNLPYWWPTK